MHACVHALQDISPDDSINQENHTQAKDNKLTVMCSNLYLISVASHSSEQEQTSQLCQNLPVVEMALLVEIHDELEE